MAGWGGRSASRLRVLTLATYGTICHLCLRDGADTADHVVPRSAGGDDSIENLRPAHASCNSARRDMPLDMWFAKYPVRPGKTLPPSRRW
ncbi:HNH endonuclease [Corynebacterium freiburgense]|uniref:HNH endonuclease n=1 Tax=Corynebacterium freiburgense TaxID=556548 RepID=UPI0004128BD6|nr:HNH endonuclease signature motif containing protein [Corynebacterium freiburgense]WJZ03464.1 HNH endonuclease [Corynebacterium freiburgense]WJZ03584.1 HNH endonuclease [Corynebacterium freiburgense]WJZ04001.1 HNH endonuclease [Corynebacterium freiburgense]